MQWSGTSTYAASAYDYENEYCPHLWTVQSTSACSFRASEGGASEGFDSQNGNNCSAYYQCLAGGAAEQHAYAEDRANDTYTETSIMAPAEPKHSTAAADWAPHCMGPHMVLYGVGVPVMMPFVYTGYNYVCPEYDYSAEEADGSFKWIEGGSEAVETNVEGKKEDGEAWRVEKMTSANGGGSFGCSSSQSSDQKYNSKTEAATPTGQIGCSGLAQHANMHTPTTKPNHAAPAGGYRGAGKNGQVTRNFRQLIEKTVGKSSDRKESGHCGQANVGKGYALPGKGSRGDAYDFQQVEHGKGGNGRSATVGTHYQANHHVHDNLGSSSSVPSTNHSSPAHNMLRVTHCGGPTRAASNPNSPNKQWYKKSATTSHQSEHGNADHRSATARLRSANLKAALVENSAMVTNPGKTKYVEEQAFAYLAKRARGNFIPTSDGHAYGPTGDDAGAPRIRQSFCVNPVCRKRLPYHANGVWSIFCRSCLNHIAARRVRCGEIECAEDLETLEENCMPVWCEIYEELWQKIPSLPERVATGSKSEAGTQGKKAGEDGARPFVEAFPFLFGLEKRATVPAAQHYRGTVTSVTEHTVTVQMTEPTNEEHEPLSREQLSSRTSSAMASISPLPSVVATRCPAHRHLQEGQDIYCDLVASPVVDSHVTHTLTVQHVRTVRGR